MPGTGSVSEFAFDDDDDDDGDNEGTEWKEKLIARSSDFTDREMHEIYSVVDELHHILPMHKKRPKGIAGILEPNPAQEMRGLHGVNLWDFEPEAPFDRVGHYRKSLVDGLLAPLEEHADVFAEPPHALETVENWYEALDLADDSRMRLNPRLRRFIEEVAHPRKYTAGQKEKFLEAIKANLMRRPDLAGFRSPVEPLSEEEFRKQYVYPHMLKGHREQMGVPQR